MSERTEADDDFAATMEAMRYVQVGGSGKRIFGNAKAREMMARGMVSVDENGNLSVRLDGSDSDEEESNENEEEKCANPECRSKSDDTIKLKRCTRCFSVQYCSRECQKDDWKRHKRAECTSSQGTKEGVKALSWQAHALAGKDALNKGQHTKAVQHLQEAVNKAPDKISTIYVDLSYALLGVGKKEQALETAYKACEIDAYNPTALLAKTKCHQALGDAESALLTIYTCENAQLFKLDPSDRSLLKMKSNFVTPLFMDLSKFFIEDATSKRKQSRRDFPLQLPLNSVTFSLVLNVTNSGRTQSAIIQSQIGTGWTELLDSSNPELAYHSTAVAGDEAIIFGGINSQALVNTVYRLRDKKLKLQECSGDIPPPVQGHAACIVGSNMYVFGGELCEMYVLNLDSWTWSKKSSMMTGGSGCPEANVVFTTLTMLNDDSLLLVGGRRPVDVDKNGCLLSNENSMTSDNMHVYSLRSNTWSPFHHAGVAPRVWGHSTHVVAPGRLLLFGGHAGKYPCNDLYLLESTTSMPTWSKLETNMRGVPPSLAYFRSSAWDSSGERLFVFGGRYHSLSVIEDSSKHKNGKYIESTLVHDGEMYCWTIQDRTWHRIRVPEFPTSCFRGGHSFVCLQNKLIVFGGSAELSSGGRQYQRTICHFDLYDGPRYKPSLLAKTKGSSKKKGRKKGKKKK